MQASHPDKKQGSLGMNVPNNSHKFLTSLQSPFCGSCTLQSCVETAGALVVS